MTTIAPLEGLETMRIANTEGKLDAIKRGKLAARSGTAEVDKVAEDFEAQFIAQMMQNMFATVPVDEEMGGGKAEEIYRSMVVDEYGKLIARTGGVGVADHVKREMIRLQEAGGRHE